MIAVEARSPVLFGRPLFRHHPRTYQGVSKPGSPARRAPCFFSRAARGCGMSRVGKRAHEGKKGGMD